jgi:biopolymer transport protein ExbD
MSESAEQPDDDEDDDTGQMGRIPFDDSEADITPMIDMTFLLLIFFIVTSTMDPAKIGNIPLAVSGLNVPAEESAVLFLANGTGGKAIVTSSTGKEFSNDEDTQTSEIVEYVTEELDQGKKQVMLFGDADVQVGEVTRVQRIIGDAFEDLENTYIAVQSDR